MKQLKSQKNKTILTIIIPKLKKKLQCVSDYSKHFEDINPLNTTTL